MNTQTSAQRTNARQDKIWERCKTAKQMSAVLASRSERLPNMLSDEMRSINRSYVNSKPHDPNAAMLELNEAYGLLETLYSNASMEVLETEIL